MANFYNGCSLIIEHLKEENMSDEIKRYSLQECILAIRSDPNTQFGFSDDRVFDIFLNTEIKSEKDIDTLLIEILSHRKNLVDKFCEEISKKR